MLGKKQKYILDLETENWKNGQQELKKQTMKCGEEKLAMRRADTQEAKVEGVAGRKTGKGGGGVQWEKYGRRVKFLRPEFMGD